MKWYCSSYYAAAEALGNSRSGRAVCNALAGRAKRRQDGKRGSFLKADWALEFKRLRKISKLRDTDAHFPDEKFDGSAEGLRQPAPIWPDALAEANITEETARRTVQHDSDDPQESAWGRLEREIAEARDDPNAPRAKRARKAAQPRAAALPAATAAAPARRASHQASSSAKAKAARKRPAAPGAKAKQGKRGKR